MAFGKKKKTEELVTPHDVASLGHKHEVAAAKDKNSAVYDHFHAQDNAKEIAAAKKRKKRYAIILGTLVGVLLILYIISMLTTQWGDLVVSIGDMQDGKTILLSESGDFTDGSVKLNGGSVKDVTNITKKWLPPKLDKENGSHNGKNYLAYSFYLKNTGDVDLDYNTEMMLTGQSKGADEAVRIMIIQDGKEAVYAKGTKASKGKESETDATKWKTNDNILTIPKTELKAKTKTKYTVVIWVEGNDKECVDAIRGGHIRSQLVFNVNPEEETKE